MHVDMSLLEVGHEYTRDELTSMWGLGGPQCLRRGIVTPRGASEILLFVTELKDGNQPDYEDRLLDGELTMESDGQAHNERRLAELGDGRDTAYLFYRSRSILPFTYYGEVTLEHVLPSSSHGRERYVFRLTSA